jgi:hypothetical protein
VAEIMRPGRKLSQAEGLCTLYAVTGDDWETHPCIGVAATAEIARAICDAVNAAGKPLPAGRGAQPPRDVSETQGSECA